MTGIGGDSDRSPSSDRTERQRVPAMDELLGRRFPVLDDGFVRVMDYMGSDEAIVQAARVSYGAGTKRLHEDRGLIRYLLRHKHTTPFEMCEIKLHVRVPMDCWRQWIRHRTANVNEYSTRYSLAIDVAQHTPPEGWRRQSSTNRQGSSDRLDASVGAELSREESDLLRRSRDVYEKRIELGVAREQARKDLPLSTYTESYWKIDLHNLLHFLALRLDSTAQEEIRRYAHTIGHEIVSVWCPLAWEAFVDYQLDALSLSRGELEVVRALVSGDRAKALEMAVRIAPGAPDSDKKPRPRELRELEEKLAKLGLAPPW